MVEAVSVITPYLSCGITSYYPSAAANWPGQPLPRDSRHTLEVSCRASSMTPPSVANGPKGRKGQEFLAVGQPPLVLSHNRFARYA